MSTFWDDSGHAETPRRDTGNRLFTDYSEDPEIKAKPKRPKKSKLPRETKRPIGLFESSVFNDRRNT